MVRLRAASTNIITIMNTHKAIGIIILLLMIWSINNPNEQIKKILEETLANSSMKTLVSTLITLMCIHSLINHRD